MKFSCLQENLNQGLNIVSHISDKTTSLPILNNILIKNENKTIKLIATNLEIGINCSIRGKVDDEGESTVIARILNEYISLLPNEKIDIETESDSFKIACANYSTKIKGNPASEFPLLPTIDKAKSGHYSVTINDFKTALQQVLFSVSPTESRSEISGVYIGIKNGCLTLAGTDSYRLAEKRINFSNLSELKGAEERTLNIIAPYKTMTEVLRILSIFQKEEELSEGESKLSIYAAENQILFVCRNIELISRLIDSKYPDYEQIIPRECKTKVIIDSKALMTAVKATSLFTKTGIYDISLSLEPETKKLKLFSLNTQLGESAAEIDINIEGEKKDIILNYRYLVDGLQNIGSDKVMIELTDGVKPCVLKPLIDGKPAENYIYLIMPIKQ